MLTLCWTQLRLRKNVGGWLNCGRFFCIPGKITMCFAVKIMCVVDPIVFQQWTYCSWTMGFCSLYYSIVLRWSHDHMSRHLCLDKRLTGGGCLDRQVYTSMCSYHVRFATRLFRSLFVPRAFYVQFTPIARSWRASFVFYTFYNDPVPVSIALKRSLSVSQRTLPVSQRALSALHAFYARFTSSSRVGDSHVVRFERLTTNS